MSIATNSLRTYIFRIATGVVGVLIGVIISRFLGPAGKGYYSAIFLFYTLYIAAFGNLGGAITYQVSRLRQSPKMVLINASFYSGLIGILTIGLFGIFFALTPKLNPNLWLVVMVTPLTLILTNLNGLFQGLNRITTLNWIGVSVGLLQAVLLSIGFLGFKINITTAILFWSLGQLITIMVAFWVSREFWLPPLRHTLNLPLLFTMLGFGWQISLNTLVGILNSRIDSFLVLGYLKTKSYGLYSVAVNAAELLWYPSSAMAVAICAHIGMANRDEAGRLTAKAARHTLLINIPLAAIMWTASWLIPLIYGERFASAMLPYRILLPGMLAYSTAAIFSTYFTNQLGKPKFPLLIAFTAMFIDLIASLILIPRMGMVGAALANSLSYVCSISLLIAVFCKNAHISVGELFRITKDDVADYQVLWGKVINLYNRKFR